MAPPSTKRTRGEEIEQARLIRWSHRPVVRAVLPALVWLHHSPNGGKRDAFTGAQMLAMGTKAGFPDLLLPVRSAEYAGLVIEMKSAIGRVSLLQEGWLEMFRANGWLCAVCRSADEARDLICRYFGLDPDQVEPFPNPA